MIESLTSDYGGNDEALQTLLEAPLDVHAHNMETVRALTPMVRDRRAGYDQSIQVLKRSKEIKPGIITKTSIMLGLGETEEEVLQTMRGKIACQFV